MNLICVEWTHPEVISKPGAVASGFESKPTNVTARINDTSIFALVLVYAHTLASARVGLVHELGL